MLDNAFIITTYIKNPDDIVMLNTCIYSIVKYYSMDTTKIIVLDDDHSQENCITVPSFCHFEKTKYPQGGEVNAIEWALQHLNEYATFIFIHDSVRLLHPLPEFDTIIPIRPFWYSSKDSYQNCEFNKIESIVENIKIDNQDIIEDIIETIKGNGTIVFGGMCMFKRDFILHLINRTTLFESLHLFDNRYKRCFFERLMYILIKKLYNIELNTFIPLTLCGDIQNHGNYYSNKDMNDISLANNTYFLKVWKGR